MASWGQDVLVPLAVALRQCVLDQLCGPRLREAYAQALVQAARLGGMKVYGPEHLLRTWFLMWGIEHPALHFVVMGQGASEAKYAVLRGMGLGVENIRLLVPQVVDAGIIAYVLCMGVEVKEFF